MAMMLQLESADSRADGRVDRLSRWESLDSVENSEADEVSANIQARPDFARRSSRIAMVQYSGHEFSVTFEVLRVRCEAFDFNGFLVV